MKLSSVLRIAFMLVSYPSIVRQMNAPRLMASAARVPRGPASNQRRIRKDRRRAHAAGDRFAFA